MEEPTSNRGGGYTIDVPTKRFLTTSAECAASWVNMRTTKGLTPTPYAGPATPFGIRGPLRGRHR